jgi:hypothetical protein
MNSGATAAWRRYGIPQVTPERIADDWQRISEWLNRKPRTICHMNAIELRALRREAIAALLAAPFGTIRRRAEKLCRSIKKEPGGNPALKERKEGATDEERPLIIVSHETTTSQSTSTHNHPRGDKTMGIKKSDAFPKKYIKVDDLGGRNIAAVIDRVEMEKVGDKDKPVLYFENDSVKPLVLNNTNWSLIEEIADDKDTDNWSGVKILLVPAKTNYQGNRVPCIRVEAAPKPAKPSREPGEDDDEDAA